MGDRGQVRIIKQGNPDLYFYTHWDASGLEGVIAGALEVARERWDDYPYFNRIIFTEMIRDSFDSTLGYGIDFEEYGDVWKVITLDYDKRTVNIRAMVKSMTNFDYDVDFSYEEFIERFMLEDEIKEI